MTGLRLAPVCSSGSDGYEENSAFAAFGGRGRAGAGG